MEFFSWENKKGEEKEQLSRRSFLKFGAASVVSFTGLASVINAGEIADLVDASKREGLQQELLSALKEIELNITSIKEQYGIEVKIRNLYATLKTTLDNPSHGKLVAATGEGRTLITLDGFLNQIKHSLQELELTLSAWPKSMLRIVEKVTFRGVGEVYDFAGHVHRDLGIMNHIDVTKGREISINISETPAGVFSHEMVHLSEKVFTGDVRGLTELWEEGLSLLGLPSPNYTGMGLSGQGDLPKYELISNEDVLKYGLVRRYSASLPEEDRATTIENIFDPSTRFHPLMSKEEGDSVLPEYDSKIKKRERLMQAFLYVFSMGEMDQNYFSTIGNPHKSVNENHKATAQELRFNKSGKSQSYEIYKAKCEEELCLGLGVSKLPPNFRTFLDKTLEKKLTKGDWEAIKH